jgi:hypothetical protein
MDHYEACHSSYYSEVGGEPCPWGGDAWVKHEDRSKWLEITEEEVSQRDRDALKCKREWDEIDAWASESLDLWAEPVIDPFVRSVYLKPAA